jgi:hypothetical protein
VADVVINLHISLYGHEFHDEATIYLEDNGRLRELKLPVKGHATPAPAAVE